MGAIRVNGVAPQTVVAEKQVIRVTARNQRIIVNPASESVSVVLSGPPGPPGPPGANGQPVSYNYTQVEPASSWVINHGLGFYPNVTVQEVDTGVVIESGVIHHSLNQMELQFNTPRAGIARLS